MNRFIPENYYVITSDYVNTNSFNLNKFDCREKAYSNFESYYALLERFIKR